MPLICVKSLIKWFHHISFQRGCHSLQNFEYIITPFFSWCCFSRLHRHRCMQHDTCQSIAFKSLFPLRSTYVQRVPVYSHLFSPCLLCTNFFSLWSERQVEALVSRKKHEAVSVFFHTATRLFESLFEQSCLYLWCHHSFHMLEEGWYPLWFKMQWFI